MNSLRLRLQERLRAEVAEQAGWSDGYAIDCREASDAVDTTGLATLARAFVVRDAGGALGAIPVDAVLAPVVAAWEPGAG